MPDTQEKILKSINEISQATDFSCRQIRAIKKASFGKSDTPFIGGKYTTALRITTWFFAHPEFTPGAVLNDIPKKKLRQLEVA